MAFTEFCCRSGGSNMNAGSVNGGTGEPSTAALVTYTGGDWNSSTNVYTAPVGADMTEAQAGRFMSIYNDGDTVPTNNQYMVARITSVNSGARTITVDGTARALRGTVVSTATGTRSAKIGGAWEGPTGTNLHPFWTTNPIDPGLLRDSSSNKCRINLKNDQTYSVTAALTLFSGNTHVIVEGYTSSYGDEGKSIIDGGTTGASYVLFSCVTLAHFRHLIFRNNGATGSSDLVNADDARVLFFNCIFHSARGNGLSGAISVTECEAYSCNQNNTSGKAGFAGANQRVTYVRCISHDNSGANSLGFYLTNAGGILVNCIADTNGNDGLFCINAQNVNVINCDFYNNGGDGIEISNANNIANIQNCNLIKNAGWGINLPSKLAAILIGNRFGAGTQANSSGTIQNGDNALDLGNSSYASNAIPYVDAPNGDFSITLADAKNAGRGAYTQTQSGYAGTVGYPDIGAAQSQCTGGGGGGVRMVNIRGGADQ